MHQAVETLLNKVMEEFERRTQIQQETARISVSLSLSVLLNLIAFWI